MRIVPVSARERITFYEAHLGAWAESAAVIGVTPGEVAGLAALTDEAREAYRAFLAAREAARAAALTYRAAARAMHDGRRDDAGVYTPGGAALIEKIKARAEATDPAVVYAAARIAEPAAGGRGRARGTTAPGTPAGVRAALQADGSLRLTWRCTNPKGAGGTVYEVRRALGEDAPAVVLGVAGKKAFVDPSLPAGTARAVYTVTAIRLDARSQPATLVVPIGTPGAGATGQRAAA